MFVFLITPSTLHQTHAAAEVEPSGDVMTPGHGVHSTDPVTDEYVFTGQSMHANAPRKLVYVPAEHGVHDADASEDANSPMGHGVSYVLPVPDAYLPHMASVHVAVPLSLE